MNKLLKFLPLLVAGLAITSCQDEDFGYEAADIKYQTEFKKAFGKIDPLQDFNLATRSAVTVNVSRESDVKIYAKYGRNYTLVGDYKGINGTQTLEFDVIEGTTDIQVTDGATAIETTIGRNISFAGGTRGITVVENLTEKTSEMLEMDHELITAWVNVIPERGTRTEANAKGTNLSKVVQDFTYVSQGEFTMYPMYSCTNASVTVGIYYTDATGAYHEVDIMNNTFTGEDLQFKRYKNEVGDPDAEWQNVTGHYATYGLNTIMDGATMTDGTHILDNVDKVRGHGVKIKLPQGTVFGMYIVNGSNKMYSESSLNTDAAVTDTENADGTHTITVDATKRGCHASSFYCKVGGKEYQFLGFEDWHNGTDGGSLSDFDLNDFMILFDGKLPTVNDQETPGWILAYEDLGNTFDWDFNDIVAKVQYVSGQNYATFTPLAAVGTLDSYVKFNSSYITGSKSTSEIHAMMGATDNAPHAIINGYDKGNPGKSVTFTVDPENFSMTVLGNVNQMGGLTLEVEKEGDATAAVIAYSGTGNTPEVICLPEFWYDNDAAPRYRYEWAWPTEHSSIKYVYPGFTTWVSDYTASTWYKAEPQGVRGTGGTVADDTKGAAVTGPFIVNVTTGTVVERVDPKPIQILQDPVYVSTGSRVPFSQFFTTVSNGALTVTSNNTSIASIENGTNYSTGNIYANAKGETTIKIHQQMGTSGEGATLKQWPVSDETVRVIVLNANQMYASQYDNTYSDESEFNMTAGQDLNIYFRTTAGSNGGVFSASSNNSNVTVSNPESAGVMSATGMIRVHAVKAGTSTITIEQASNADYAGAEKTITINISAATTVLSLAQSSVSVGSNSGIAYVAINTNNTESTPVVAITEGSEYFDAVYEDGKVKVTGKAVGSGTVRVSQAASESFSAATDVTLEVTVTAPQHDLIVNTPLTGNTLSSLGQSATIEATCTTGTVKYEISAGANYVDLVGSTITVKDGPGTVRVRVYVEADGDLPLKEEFVEFNVTYANYGTKINFTQDTQIELPLVTESTTKITFNIVVTNNWASMMMKDGTGSTKIITAEDNEWNNREFNGNGVYTIDITNSDHISLIKGNGIRIEGYMTNNAELYYKVQ